jgi:hypothetical protein
MIVKERYSSHLDKDTVKDSSIVFPQIEDFSIGYILHLCLVVPVSKTLSPLHISYVSLCYFLLFLLEDIVLDNGCLAIQ